MVLCVGVIFDEDYVVDVLNVVWFLFGWQFEVMKEFEQKMYVFVVELKFEQVVVVCNQMSLFVMVLYQQVIEVGSDSDVDVLVVVVQGGCVCVNFVMVCGGWYFGDKVYFLMYVESVLMFVEGGFGEDVELVEVVDVMVDVVFDLFVEEVGSVCGMVVVVLVEVEVFDVFIVQYYFGNCVLFVFVVSYVLVSCDLLELLFEQVGYKVLLVWQLQGQWCVWLLMVEQNVCFVFVWLLFEQGLQQVCMCVLVDVFSYDSDDFVMLWIECFDISYMMGEVMQVLCVVYYYYKMQLGEYCCYNIMGIMLGDDYVVMWQVFMCCYEKMVEQVVQVVVVDEVVGIDGELMCQVEVLSLLLNIVLIDGGKGQVEIVWQVFIEFGFDMLMLVGVVKGEGCKVGFEMLVFVDGCMLFEFGKESVVLMFVVQICDEVYCFVIIGMWVKWVKVCQML